MAKIAVLSSKGGVGKTSLAWWLAQVRSEDHPVLLVDLDPQRSSTILSGLPGAQWAQGRITVVEQRKFNPAKLPNAEDVILDCPPRLDDQCIAAAKFADVIAIPVRPGQLDLHAVSDTLGLLDAAEPFRAKLGLAPAKRLIVPNMLTNTVLTKELLAALKPTNICHLPGLKLRAEYGRASSDGKRLPRGPALHDIERLAEAIMARLS